MDLSSALVDSCPGNVQGVTGYLFLTLINSLLSSKCKLEFKESYNEDYSSRLQDGEEFDFIVIGAGSAGSVVANKLSENPNWKVLVVEAGEYPSAASDIPALLYAVQGTREDWQYTTEPSENSCLSFKDGRCKWPRGKVLGGSSSLNAMLFIKGFKKDYDQWAEFGNNGWNWDNVKKQYEKLDKITSFPYQYDSGDPIKYAMQESYQQKGYQLYEDDNPESPIGTLMAHLCIKDGIRYNAAKAFLGKYKERKHLFTSLNSFVQKILIDPVTKTATSVEIKINEHILTIKARKEIILSGGSINSPQILMLSGIGPKENLQEVGIDVIKDLPVGENLQDHLIHLGLDIALNPDSINPEGKTENLFDILYQYFMHQKGKLATVGMLNFWGFINTKKDSIYPNIQYHHILFPKNDDFFINMTAAGTGITDDVFSSKREVLQTNNMLSIMTTLLNPKSTGKIILKSNNPEDHPLIYSGYFSDKNGEDLQIMLEGIRFMEELFETEPLQKFNPEIVKHDLPACDKYEFRTDEYWKCSLKHLTTTVYHPTSTCTMGPKDDGTAVVDPRLKVHGIKNLRVVDASIMPKVVSVNTHAPAMMIGHKGGEMIIEDWSEKRDEL